MAFNALRLSAPLLKALAEEGYEKPTPIQAQAIPPALEGRDILGCAQTGTGKTAAFALPLIQRLTAAREIGKAAAKSRMPGRPHALILAPTRELAVQIADSINVYGRHAAVKTCLVFGGVGQNPQVAALRAGVDVVVATPGRLLDLIQQRHCSLQDVHVLVLDEADRMLDMGFIKPIRTITGMVPKERQTMLFSATMPKEVKHLAESLLREPVRVEVTPVASAAPKIGQRVMHVARELKQPLLERLLESDDMTSVVVFTRTKHGADRVMKRLVRARVDALAIHGNKNQNQRQRALDAFRTGKVRVLVATDVAARGIDVDGVSHVVNYDVPVEAESYVHRIGRTGRAGATGQAITFCEPAERGALKDIEKLVGKPVPVAAVPQDLQALSKLPEPGEEPARREHPHSGRGRQGRSAGRPQGGDGGGSGRGERNAPKASSGKSPAHGRGGAHRKVARSGSSTAGGTSGGGTAAASARAAHPASSTPHPRAHQFPSARTPSRRGRK
jgi:ATP-dependent RNA helicase RhlE